MKPQFVLVAILSLSLAGAPGSADAQAAVSAKKASTSSRLLLPFFLVDTARSDGADTFFSVRNESTQPVDVRVSYFASDRPSNPIHEPPPVTLGGKQLRQFVVSSTPNLLVDDDGFARGYAIVETVEGGSSIHGDYYQLNPDEGFASGMRLPDIDPASPHNDLCSVHVIRFLSGGAFDDTEVNFWLDTAEQPDPETPVASYAVYRENGTLVFATELHATEVAFRRTGAELTSVQPTPFGVLEIQFNGMDGYVSGTLAALGLYSVGVESICLD